jgi:hypothetical protein
MLVGFRHPGTTNGESTAFQQLGEAIQRAIAEDPVVAIPHNRRIFARRVRLEIEAGVGTKKGAKAFDEVAQLLSIQRWALIPTGTRLSSRSMEHVKQAV